MTIPAAHAAPPDARGIRCRLCPHYCTIPPGEFGECRTRQNRDGTLVVLPYGRLSALSMDPIEKKPLFHYRPGSWTFSIASAGCNLVCPFCQNASLSKALCRTSADRLVPRRWSPVELIEEVVRQGAGSISLTYSEPVLQFEYTRDVAALAAEQQIELIWVTNGQINPDPAEQAARFIAAANVDLKCFNRASYKDVLGGSLRTTLRAIEIFKAAGVWVEVTTLVIPEFNDSRDELTEIARFIASVDPRIPWHVSRFHGADEWADRGVTPVETLLTAREIGLNEGLQFVYTGNIPGQGGENTHCPACQAVVIERVGYRVRSRSLSEGRCAACGEEIAGIGIL